MESKSQVFIIIITFFIYCFVLDLVFTNFIIIIIIIISLFVNATIM